MKKSTVGASPLDFAEINRLQVDLVGVHQLEEAKDTADLPEATGESIAREFERYLRRRGKEKP